MGKFRRQHQSKHSILLIPFTAGLCVVAFVSVLTLSAVSFGTTNIQGEAMNPVSKALREGVSNSINRLTTINAEDLPVLDARKLYPIEDPIPNPPLANGYDTFSACMLIMDDNHRLVEWLAYHYHVLPLRHLVVTIDPRSVTSSTWLFNRWRKMGMTVEVWKDSDFWRKDLKLAPIAANASLQTKRDRHRGRQKYFYRSCLIHLKDLNKTWVALHDSDEFLLPNHAGGDQYEKWEEKMQAWHDRSVQHGDKIRVKPSMTPPSSAEEGAIIKYIRHEQEAGLEYYQSPCIGVPRLSFGAVEMSYQGRQLNVPEGIDALQLDTLRYRRHSLRNDFVKNALGKVVMDISRIDILKSPYFMSLHRPIKKICSAPWHDDWTSGLRINHYLGSWESYAIRDDSRKGGERSREQWEYKATTNVDMSDDNIRPWITGLVDTHGLEQAQALLDKAGLPPGHRVANESQWNLLPEKLEAILSKDVTIANDNKMVAFDAWVRERYRNNIEGREHTIRLKTNVKP